jgi:Holliday junction resolvase RusA-like endonuclease
MRGRRDGPMAMHLEFVVAGPPISNQQSTQQGRANLASWKATIAGAATLAWPNAPLTIELKAIIINFYAGSEPSVDTDNMSKPILDVMQGIAYLDDRQIIQAELTHARLAGAYQIGGVRPIIVNELQAQAQFVYVRIEDPVNPFPLPK